MAVSLHRRLARLTRRAPTLPMAASSDCCGRYRAVGSQCCRRSVAKTPSGPLRRRARVTEQAEQRADPRPVVAVLGAFDGLHRGHQALLRGAVERAHALGARVVGVTFDPDPEHVLRPSAAPPDLTTLADRVRLMREQGVDEVCVLPFTPSLAQMAPAEFVAALRERYPLVEVWVGENFGFGRDRMGSPATLAELGQRHGFTVRTFAPVYDGERPISSTRVRELLLAGDVREAARLLGRPHRLAGEVISGARRGRQIGFPT